MKNLIFHLPKYCEKIAITSESAEDYIDTEKSAEELDNILTQQLPCGMYPELEQIAFTRYLRKNFDLPTLEKMKRAMDETGFASLKGMDFYRCLNEIIKEKEQTCSS